MSEFTDNQFNINGKDESDDREPLEEPAINKQRPSLETLGSGSLYPTSPEDEREPPNSEPPKLRPKQRPSLETLGSGSLFPPSPECLEEMRKKFIAEEKPKTEDDDDDKFLREFKPLRI